MSSTGKTQDMSNTFMHLTNVAIQKTEDGFMQGTDSKLSLNTLKMLLKSKHGAEAVEKCKFEIDCVGAQGFCFDTFCPQLCLADFLHPLFLRRFLRNDNGNGAIPPSCAKGHHSR